MGNSKSLKLFDIPHHRNMKIDKELNIYILDNNDNIIKIIPKTILKFTHDDTTFYAAEMRDVTFYGVRNRFEFTNHKFIDENNIIVNDIIFRKIPDFLDGYYISNFGAVYSLYSNRLRKREVDDDGYHRISFPYSNMTHIAIHRLVYKTWVSPIKDGYVVDHIDNNKWNNYFRNLQCITAAENSRKAAEDGCYISSLAWNKDKVIRACEMMAENISVKDIAEYFGIFPSQKKLYKNFRNQLYHFRNHTRSWVDITSKYDFSSYDGFMRPDSKFRDTEIIEMRQMYNEGKTISEIAEIFNTEPNAYLSLIIKGLKRKVIKLQK